MKVLVTGATGLIGRALVPILVGRGDTVSVLSRSGEKARACFGGGVSVLEGDPAVKNAWLDLVKDMDGVVHLAGETVLGSWSEPRRKKIRESRIESTKLIAAAVAAAPKKPVLVSASALGYYGPRGDEVLDESTPMGTGFLAELCADWEKACEPARAAGARVVNPRIGIVLDPEEGALGQMLTPFKLFLGGHTGSGNQWMSWIHRRDMARLLVLALDDARLSGPFNAVAPEPVTSRAFAKALGAALSRPSFLPVPAFALKLRFGESASVILTGARLTPKKVQDLGFVFEHPKLEEALRDLVALRASA
jgi:uncharacterized protein (TIGR01777 family)